MKRERIGENLKNPNDRNDKKKKQKEGNAQERDKERKN